ncbi:hypothetical protein LCGC14_1904120 [marine sediment metagenome]|uniref:HK97 gp10 family phage protein n=1 Tax=marine sediment metagenome TaxID=412755 RepID=A0A0F9ITS5_9ZZZZ
MVTQSVSVTITGWKDVQRKLRKMPSKARIEGKALTKRIAQFIVRSAKQRVGPMKTGTGRLMKSIRALPIKNGFKVVAGKGAINTSGVNYARFQEFGFKPHSVRISALDKSSRLYQELKAGGTRGRIFVRRWTPFLGPALRKALNRLEGIELKRTADRIVK